MSESVSEKLMVTGATCAGILSLRESPGAGEWPPMAVDGRRTDRKEPVISVQLCCLATDLLVLAWYQLSPATPYLASLILLFTEKSQKLYNILAEITQ